MIDRELQSKIEAAIEYIGEAAAAYHRVGGVCALVSWGKDSLAMLEVALAAGLRPDVLHFQEPYNLGRARYGREMAQHYADHYGLRVFTPPPVRTWAYERGEHYVLGASYDLGGGELIDIPKDVVPWKVGHRLERGAPHRAVCGLNDHLCQPLGTFSPPWGAGFIGHKDTDEDPVLGNVPLDRDELATPPGTLDLLYPLRSWTDADVWGYLAARKIPVDWGKYSATPDRAPLQNKAGNTDYVSACVRCMRAASSESVPCPLRGGAKVHGVREQVPTMSTLEREYFSAEHPEPEPATTTTTLTPDDG